MANINLLRKGEGMKTLCWLAVIVAAPILFGCDSPDQAKAPAEPVAQQSAVAEKAPGAEAAKAVAPAAESAPLVASSDHGKAEQTATATAPVVEEAGKAASATIGETAKTTEDTTAKGAKQTDPPAAPESAAAAPVESTPKAAIPQEILLKASNGNVAFPHGMHAEAYACKTCHGDETPAAFGITKDLAHKLCKDCHKTAGAGPTACNGCHKK